jgi:hypothetical protein
MGIDIEKINIEVLRNDLINYFMGLAYVVSPVAFMNVAEVEKATPEELVEIAINNGFSIENYLVKTR